MSIFRGAAGLKVLLALVLLGLASRAPAQAATVDLVVNVISDQPAYLSFDLEHFTVTISNNGPDPATNVALTVNHPLADVPFEASATCQAVPGPNPNGPAVCPPGSGIAPSPSFTRTGTMLGVVLPLLPSQSQVMIQFDNRSRCPAKGQGAPETRCFGAPEGNFPITAIVSAAEAEALGATNTATTNIFLYPPSIGYKVVPLSYPATAAPGSIVDYDFEVQSNGNQPSDQLSLAFTLFGADGTMLPLTATNNPYGLNGSTLPNTVLLGIDCVSTVLGTYPPGSVFPNPPTQSGEACPAAGLIFRPLPSSPTKNPPITGFSGGTFLANLPGTLDSPPTGGAMRFRAHVLVGDPICVGAGDSGHRDLVFKVTVSGLIPETASGASSGDNVACNDPSPSQTAICHGLTPTQVPGTCKVADIAFTTGGNPTPVNLVGGTASWTYTATVTNMSSGGLAGTATNVPVQFEHHQYAFSETQGPLSCSSVPAGLCPASLAGGTSSPSGFSFQTVIPSLPPLATVTFSQAVTETQVACTSGGNPAKINLSGHADPSTALADTNDGTTPSQPTDGTAGVYFGNNGEQSIVQVQGVTTCPGSPGPPNPGIVVAKSGPFPSAAAAGAGTPLVGQTAAAFLPDATTVWYKVVVTNIGGAPLMLGDVTDVDFPPFGFNATPPSGFVPGGSTLAGWGILCTASPAGQTCHEIARTTVAGGYNNQLILGYDPALHSGSSRVPLAGQTSLTYVIPFTTPVHTNKCQPAQLTTNSASAAFVDALGNSTTAGPGMVQQWIGTPTCVPGMLAIDKKILPPASMTSIPTSGLVTYEVTLTNLSTTTTLDIPHFVDTPNASGVTIAVVSIACSVVSGGAKCPPTPVVPGIKTPASGSPSPLPQLFYIDHEWGSVGNNTFPPGSVLKLTLTLQLSNPSRDFNFLTNTATFSGENDPNGWTPATKFVPISLPATPEISLQKRVSPQIAGPNTLVTYTVTITNVGKANASNAVFTDPLPAALLAANPSGYRNVSCTVVNGSFLPLPLGTAVCPTITSTASGLSATIATLGINSALQFTYQALMPTTMVSIDNLASVTVPDSSGNLSFGAGTAQSRENVQVVAEPVTAIPTLSGGALVLLAALLGALGVAGLRR